MYQYQCIIKRVVDGDTIEIDLDCGFDIWLRDVSVRVLHIDCPETRTKDPFEKIAGLKAKARVQELLPEGSKVVVNTVIKKDTFKRILGDFLIDGKESLSNILIAEGHARTFM